jgi:hypothetical protein
MGAVGITAVVATVGITAVAATVAIMAVVTTAAIMVVDTMAVVTTAITMVAVTMAIIMAMVDVIGTAGGTLGVARVGFGPLVVGFGPATKAGPYTIQPNSPGLGVGSLPRVGYRLVGRCTHNGHQENVCFTPGTGHAQRRRQCPLSANNGHAPIMSFIFHAALVVRPQLSLGAMHLAKP